MVMSMIEVEKKFIGDNPDDVKRLLEGAEFMGEKTFADDYYDTDKLDLALKNIWLRSRDGKWELKFPYNYDAWHELETESEIADYLKLPKDISLTQALENTGYKIFVPYTTTRKKYKKGEFTIDVDSLDFGYEMIEIELMVNDISEADEAVSKIIDFAKQYNLEVKSVRGKAQEYLLRHKKEHYDTLVKAGVITAQQAAA